ncbi:MAG: aldo/keto reductase, partial [Okeania sp. SIO3B3]|nr:aldo/keto reductase [Okeania sp. SIO3B3]
MRALDDMVRAGKILYIGVSDTPAWVVARSNTLAELRGWTQFVALQIEYSLIERTVERDLLPMARAFDMAVTPWGCLGGGVLTGKYNKDPEAAGRAKQLGRITERGLEIGKTVVEVADETGYSPSQVALGWVRQQPGVVLPIIGAKTAPQLEDNLKSLDVNLSAEHLTKLNEVSKIDLGFPHDFLSRPQVRTIAFGGTYDSIDNHRTSGV